MQKIGTFTVNRRAAIAVATLIGVGFGLHNAWYGVVDVTLSARMVAYLVLSIPLTAITHELTHGLTARLLGYRPIYGFKPPLIYITFDATVTAVHYKLIAIAPFIILTGACAALIAGNIVPQLAYFCLMINVMGAIADLWATVRLLAYNRGYVVQDTKAGFDLFQVESRAIPD
jgi:hypothetical protein